MGKYRTQETRNVYRIQRFIDTGTCANIVRALIMMHLDHCNLQRNHKKEPDQTTKTAK